MGPCSPGSHAPPSTSSTGACFYSYGRVLTSLRSKLKIGKKFLLHDPKALADLLKHSSVHNINQYFGSQIALYFAWVEYYTKYLIVPAVAGTILYLRQLYLGEVDIGMAPLFNIMIAIWGTLFLEFWKRENSSLSYVWGVEDAEERENDTEIAKVCEC
jgi:hypothetical protein